MQARVFKVERGGHIFAVKRVEQKRVGVLWVLCTIGRVGVLWVLCMIVIFYESWERNIVVDRLLILLSHPPPKRFSMISKNTII